MNCEYYFEHEGKEIGANIVDSKSGYNAKGKDRRYVQFYYNGESKGPGILYGYADDLITITVNMVKESYIEFIKTNKGF